MTCPTCGEAFVACHGGFSTLVGYYSPPGHDHDDNCRAWYYSCANGHHTLLHIRNTCPVCDWKGKATCFCHRGEKVDKPDVKTVKLTRDEALELLNAAR